MKVPLFLAAATVFLTAGPAVAEENRIERIHFPPGKTGTTVHDRIVGRDSVSYVVGAEAGQTLSVTLKASNTATYFNVYEPGRGPGDQALAVSELTGPMVPEINRFSGKLPSSGDYKVVVYLYRAAARRKERSSYTLDVSISALGASMLNAPVQSDYADGLQGGPDFWAVKTATPGARLSVRSAPSGAAERLALVEDGAVLRNLGCRMNEGRRWCRVETVKGAAISGWAAGDFLREGSQPPADR